MKNIIKIFTICLLIIVNLSCITVKAEVSEREFWDTKILRHAMGGIEDENGKHVYNNTVEALENSIKLGYKTIEIDLILTKDNKLVCSHGWSYETYKNTGVEYDSENPVMTYDEFMNTKIQGKYTTMDAETWLKYAISNPDIMWEIDFRTLDDKQANMTAIKLKQLFRKNEYLLDRVMLQVGTKEMYNQFHKYLKTAKHYQYFIHKKELKIIDEIIDFCVNNKIESIAVNYKYMTKKRVKKIHDANIKILCYTIDNIDLAQDMLNMGADCICSNFLFDVDLQ